MRIIHLAVNSVTKPIETGENLYKKLAYTNQTSAHRSEMLWFLRDVWIRPLMFPEARSIIHLDINFLTKPIETGANL